MISVRVAVVGSRNLHVDDLSPYLPDGVTEIVSGGAKGIDTDARTYALQHRIKLTEILPEYEKYGRNAPLRRNISIIENADFVLVFWDGKSHGTRFVIETCQKRDVPMKVYTLQTEST